MKRTKIRFELERLEKEKELNQLHHEIGSFHQNMMKDTAHKQWIAEQKQAIERRKMEKELAAHGLSVTGIRNIVFF